MRFASDIRCRILAGLLAGAAMHASAEKPAKTTPVPAPASAPAPTSQEREIQPPFSLMWHVPSERLELKIEAADNREKAKRVLINTFDAETYQAPEEEMPDPVGLAQEAYDYLERVTENQFKIPAGVLVVTGGCDVQGDRLEFEFVGHGVGRTMHEEPQVPNFVDPGVSGDCELV
jgi:phage terminase large subunit GpA-like protein